MADDPTLINPHNVTTLAELKISYLTELIFNYSNSARDGFGCKPVQGIMPLANLSMLALAPSSDSAYLSVGLDPADLDVGLLDLQKMANGLFPSPVNNSGVGEVAGWWMDAAVNDKNNTRGFLEAVVNKCGGQFCKSGFISIGNPDIAGIG